MAFDIIVYKQEELEAALNSGYTSIALCDNSFTLPESDEIVYTLLGEAKVSFAASSISSYVSSYMMSSYFLSSFSTSYMYEYESSYFGSYLTSFISSYNTSFYSDNLKEHKECILVNGYGINLI